MDSLDRRFDHITETIIGCAYRVANVLGHGFLEKCYQNALAHELEKAGLKVQKQVELNVMCDGICVGEYYADLIVNDSVVIELKAIEQLAAAHSAQCINYLAATRMPVCLLINFGRRVDVRRLAGPSLRNPS